MEGGLVIEEEEEEECQPATQNLEIITSPVQG